MIRTLLIDLDNTLLGNEISDFIPAYVRALSAHMSASHSPQVFAAQLLKSTRRMLENDDPERPLEQAFSEHFYPALETTKESLRPAIEEFYRVKFPGLQPLTHTWPQAKAMVEEVLGRGYEVVIATNPLFPRTAIEQRLAWAGLPADEYPFALVTSFERWRFSKPSLGYYAQILGMLGRAPYEAAMIGDDRDADLDPARLLGMATFQIGPASENGHPCGALEDVLPWLLDQAETQIDTQAANTPLAILGRLKGHLAALLSMTEAIEPVGWLAAPAPNEWSALEIVCHLRDVEIEVHQARLSGILANERLFIPHVDSDRWAQERKYLSQSVSQALARFTAARKKTIDLLSHLDAQSWARPAQHALLGPVTLAEIAAIAPEHDQLHLSQLRSTLDCG